MAEKKQKDLRGTTPRGVFQYPALVQADFGNEKFPKPDGEYKVRLILSEQAAEGLVKVLTPVLERAVQEGEEKFAALPVASRKKLKEMTVNDLFNVEYDPATEEPTGNLLFNFKMKASGVRKLPGGKTEPWNSKPALFDAAGKPLKAKAIWGGSEGKVSFTASPYFVEGTGTAGVSLRLNAVQVLELVAGGDRKAGAYGFGTEEGYVGGDDEDDFDGEPEAAAEGSAEEAGEDDF